MVEARPQAYVASPPPPPLAPQPARALHPSPAPPCTAASQALHYVTAGRDLTSIYAFKFSVTLSSGDNGVVFK